MKSRPIVRTLVLFTLFIFFSKTLFAQLQTPGAQLQTLTVSMTGVSMRAPLDLPCKNLGISLCNLAPGNQYAVIAIGRNQGQSTSFTLQVAGGPAAQQSIYTNEVRFTAEGTCTELQLQVSDVQDTAPVQMYLSVKCVTCPEANAWKKNLLNAAGAAVIQVESGTAEELITETLIGGACYDVKNVTFFGAPGQIGTFSNGATNIGFQNGIIIATGDIDVATGPNDLPGANSGYISDSPDDDLSTLTTGALKDMASIEFDFTPTDTLVSFQFVFASEEYCEFALSQFNDVFGFFISGPGIPGTQNIALIPGTNNPISINNLNHLVNNDYYINNQPFSIFMPLCGQTPATGQVVDELQYDGFTKPLLAAAKMIPCSTYHIKLKIADVGDSAWDSAVFFKAGSFDGGGDATVDFVVNGDPGAPEANEGCDNVSLLLNRIGSDQNQPVTVSFKIGGTASPGADFSPIDTSFTIPAGQDQLSVPIDIVSDILPEGVETIVLTLDNSCSCNVTQKTLAILDDAPTEITENVSFCAGGSYTIGDSVYTQAGMVVDTLPGMNGACDTIATYILQLLPQVNFTDTLQFYPGDTVIINGTAYTTAGIVNDTLPGSTGICDTFATYVLVSLTPAPDEEPCDEATIGCVKYELLGITEDNAGNNTYRIRVTNNCMTNLMYIAFSLPPGVTALEPPNNSIYTAASGREYSVRNPNFSPFYSIRFKSDIPEISNGESDLFEFKLPAFANPLNIHGIVRVQPKIFYETYLNTFNCPEESEPKPDKTDWTIFKNPSNPVSGYLTIFPNPTSGVVYADLSDWQGEPVKVQVLDSRGQRVQQTALTAGTATQELQLPENLPNGMYFIEILSENGEKRSARVIVQR